MEPWYDQKINDFIVKKGPIFTNLLLADEINRAPAKVESALLEAMQEKQVTIGQETFYLPNVFLVLATQNPIEQEGTYPLPEAQLDRFMMKLKVHYPSKKKRLEILNLTEFSNNKIQNIVNTDTILKARELVNNIYADEKIKNYIVEIVSATRNPEIMIKNKKYDWLWSISKSINLLIKMCQSLCIFTTKRIYNTKDIKAVANDILNHRIVLSYEASANETKIEDIIKTILEKVKVI